MRKNVHLPNGNNKLTLQPEKTTLTFSPLRSSYIRKEGELSK